MVSESFSPFADFLIDILQLTSYNVLITLMTANYDVELILKYLNNVDLSMRDCTRLNIFITINEPLKEAEMS